MFLQDEGTEHSISSRLGAICAEHVQASHSTIPSETDEYPQAETAPHTTHSTPTTTPTLRGSKTPRPKIPEGIARRISRSPEPNLTGEISRQLYDLDATSPAAQSALQALPTPLSHLTTPALRAVLHYIPLHACTALPEPLEFLSFEAKLLTGMHALSADATSACARRYNSLNLSDSDLKRSSLMRLARFLPLLPPVTSFTLSFNKRTLAAPQSRRLPRTKETPVPPNVQKARQQRLEMHNFIQCISPSLTHLCLANSSIARNVLYDICLASRTLRSLDLSNMVLTAPKNMQYGASERSEDVNRCIRRLPHLRYLSLSRMQSTQPISLRISHMTALAELDISHRSMVWQGPNGAVSLRSELMEDLSQVSTLVSLNLCGNQICRKPRNRSSVRADGNDVEIAIALIAGLAKLTALEKLNLACTRVLPGLLRSFPSPSALSRMNSLTYLDISGGLDCEETEVCEGQWQKLGKLLTKVYSLKELHAARLGLKLRSAADLLMQLCQMRYLETLHLSDNNLAVTSPHEDRDIQLLCSISQSLQNISNLRRLDLSSCQLSSQGIHVHRMQRGKRATLHKGTGEQHFGQVKHECREGFLALIASSSLSADPHEAASRVRRSGLMRHIEILNLVGNPMIEKG